MTLVDQAARDRIAKDLRTTLVVEAAAGTGKTTALVGRILALLVSGEARLANLVAVTFTEKAAGEMKLRLREAIDRARDHASGDERKHLDRALGELEAAHIGTIHAFSADLLRERPIEAKVDPRFEMAAEDEAERLYDDAFTRWFQQTLASPPEGVARVLRRATRERDREGPRHQLWDAGRTLLDKRDFPAPWATSPDFDRRAAIDKVVEALRELAQFGPLGDKDAKYIGALVRLCQSVERTVFEIERRESHGLPRDHDGVETLLRALASDSYAWKSKGWGDWYEKAAGIRRQDVLDAKERVKQVLDAFVSAADADLAPRLFEELRSLISSYEALKTQAGKLDFIDLLVITRDLLVRDAAVRASLQARFTHLLVDEFQDTDPLQAEILLLLAADDPSESDWTRARPVPGKLFVVGDPKQSIYRFRRADVSLYEEIKKRLLERGASLIHLQTSFRSAREIQDFVNAAFTPLMTGERKSQAAYVPLAKFREGDGSQPSIVALPVPRPYADKGWINNSQIDASYPDAVGAYIDWLVRHSGWTATERGSAAAKPIGPQHVCILFKRVQSFGKDETRPYVRALEVRGIPHVLVGGKSFHDREEIIALRAALQAIEWPDDTLHVYATLHGPFFALADDSLLAFRRTHRHLHPLRKRDDALLTDLTRPVAEALDVLARLYAGRNRRPIADTLADLLETTRAHAGISIWPAGEQALGNVLRILDIARRFEQRSVTSFRAFVVHLEDQADRGGGADAPVVEEGSDGVRIMTVHKAKGLEFPVVILANPCAPITRQKPSRWVDAEKKLWAVPLCGAAPRELLDNRDEVLAQDREEAIRLLYVATTRARELLVIPAIGDERSSDGETWLDPLGPVVYPRSRSTSGATPAPRCPAFGMDTVLERPPGAHPLFAGSGVTPRTVGRILEIADGAIIGTALKADGDVRSPVDPRRVRAMVRAAGRD